MDDAGLLSRILEGDERAFTEVIERHHGSLVRLAATIVGDRGTAEEIAQETWLAVLDGVRSFEARSSLKTWIFRILVNRARTRRTRDAKTSTFSSLPGDGEDSPAVDPSRFDATGHWSQPPRRWDDDTPDRILQRAEALAELDAALARLPANQRAVVSLRDIEGCSSQEVCAVLEITEVNQRVLLHRARARLRTALERYVERG